jgi:hypothetical protein
MFLTGRFVCEQPDDAGISLIHMALAFVVRHWVVTAAIIGPRTMEQLGWPRLPGAGRSKRGLRVLAPARFVRQAPGEQAPAVRRVGRC